MNDNVPISTSFVSTRSARSRSTPCKRPNSGHPGLPLGMAPAAYVLWTKFLRHNPKNPKWFGRDRFLLSAGHGSMLLYILLHLTGYDLSLDEIKRFRQLHSKTPGHPENILTPGVEITTGPLGQGFANGVGMGIAQKHLAGDFQPTRLSGHRQLHLLHLLGRRPDGGRQLRIRIARRPSEARQSDLSLRRQPDHDRRLDAILRLPRIVTKRFEAAGWHVFECRGRQRPAKRSRRRSKRRRRSKDKPKLIRVKTIIGFGMPKQGTQQSPLGRSRRGSRSRDKTKSRLAREQAVFTFRKRLSRIFARPCRTARRLEKEWKALVKKYEKQFPDLGKTFKETRSGQLPTGWEKALPKFDNVESKATRAYSGEVINAIAEAIPQLIGGSADLTPSNNTYIKSSLDFEPGAIRRTAISISASASMRWARR